MAGDKIVKTNVVALPGAPDPTLDALPPPKHFKAAQKQAWNDLTSASPEMAKDRQNLFTFELAAILMAKFRAGKTMHSAETKELKKQLVALGLAKPDDDGPQKTPRKNAHYFDGK